MAKKQTQKPVFTDQIIEAIDDVMENFDFHLVRRVIREFGLESPVPSLRTLRVRALKLLADVANNKDEFVFVAEDGHEVGLVALKLGGQLQLLFGLACAFQDIADDDDESE